MYTVVAGYQKDPGLEAFLKAVEKKQKEGWKCQGGICVVQNYDNYNLYYQAMVKEKK
jgi:hypothetical protein